MPKIFTSKTQKTGEIGENIAVRFLMKRGFTIIERNYTKKWGEIDIVAEKSGKLYFVEVKSVSIRLYTQGLPYGTNDYRAEDNMHPWKLKRLARVIQTYLMSNKKYDDMEWQVDLLIVYLDMENKKARVKIVPDIVL